MIIKEIYNTIYKNFKSFYSFNVPTPAEAYKYWKWRFKNESVKFINLQSNNIEVQIDFYFKDAGLEIKTNMGIWYTPNKIKPCMKSKRIKNKYIYGEW